METKVQNKALKHLNKILNGEEIAVESFEHFLTSLPKDSSIWDEFKNVKQIHKQNIDMIEERLIEDGVAPSHKPGILGSISGIAQNMRKMAGEAQLDILKEAVNALKMCVTDGEKILSEIDDEDILEFANYILDRDKLNLMVIERMLAKQLAFV